MKLTFGEVSKVNKQRCERWHPGFAEGQGAWSGADWSNAMAGEAGEVANVVKKLRRYECGLHGNGDPAPEELKAMLAKEIADVFLYLDLLSTYYGIDMPKAVVEKFNEVSVRQGFQERL